MRNIVWLTAISAFAIWAFSDRCRADEVCEGSSDPGIVGHGYSHGFGGRIWQKTDFAPPPYGNWPYFNATPYNMVYTVPPQVGREILKNNLNMWKETDRYGRAVKPNELAPPPLPPPGR